MIRRSVFAILLALVTAVTARATIGTALQAQLGNPSNATADTNNHSRFLIQRAQYAMDYNDTTRAPNWVAWDLTSGDVGSSGRSNFIVDSSLPAGFYQVLTTDYSGSGYDRGHMCPSADRTVTAADNQVVFTMSNMIPQAPDNNQGVWASFETYCRTLAGAGNELLITSGPSGFAGSTIASGVGIPGYTWKIAVVVPAGTGTALSRITASTRVIAIKIPNIAGVRNNPWEQYITTVAQIESDTGYTFFATLPSSVATALRVQVDGQSSTGSPTITTQPTAQTAAVGGNASFTVAATSTPSSTFTYQWIKDDVDITGATNATLSLTNVQAADAAIYTVIVTNSVGSVTSAAAALVITGLPPSIAVQPVAKSASAGSTVSFVVTASGSPTLSYQWRKAGSNLVNGGSISGANAATLTLTNVQGADAIGTYDVVVTNSVNSATSNAVALTVNAAAPTITSPPAAQIVSVGGTTTLTVVATGTTPLTYQWRKASVSLVNGGVISGVNTATLTLTGVTVGDAGSYDVVVSNGINPDATSIAATVTVSTAAAGSQVAYTGGTYSQNFDGLPSAGTFTLSGLGPFSLGSAPINATSLAGWSIAKVSGSGANETFNVGTGSANTGSIYSFGASAATDRALGAVLSGTVGSVWGVVLTNNTGTTITQFTVGYTGEQWRYGGTTGIDKISFEYQVGGSDITTGTFTAATTLDFTSRVSTGTSGALDGNATANRAAINATVTGLTWASGQTLVLRWKDFDVTGSDDGLAIDDFTFTTPVAAAPITPVITGTTPANAATNVAGNTPISVTFNQPVTVAGSWFSISSAAIGTVAATVTGGPTTYTLTPPVNFTDNDAVTVTFVASQITDTASGTLHPAANTTLSFTTAAPVSPGITTQPVVATVNAGASTTFTVVASGTAPFSYQWRKAGVAITGNGSAATATLTLANVQAADAGNYDVVISNGVNPSVTSTAVALTVTPAAPTITTQPVAQTVFFGGNATFAVAATGTTPLTYQWRKAGVALVNGGVVSGATSATLTLTSISAADAGTYDVVVANGVNPSATSTAAALTVTLPPPGPQTNYAGGTYTQNFDTLPSAGTFTFVGNGPFALDAASPGIAATGLAGWSFAKYAGSGANALFKFDTGASNSGGAYSYGAAAATDRALGSLSSGTAISRFGVAFVNTTTSTITQFTLGYTGEQWRHGGATTPNTLSFSYIVGGVDIKTGTFTAVPALDFIAPIITTTAGALDGNLAANRTVIPATTITGLNWAPGQTLVLRWTDVDDPGSDDGLAIDDFTFSGSAAPNITTQPASQTVTVGSSATLSVVATGAPTVTYQWRKNGVIVPNATAASLSLSGLLTSDTGSYDVIVTTAVGSVTSTAAVLMVNKAAATVTLSGLAQIYTSVASPPTVTTSPAGLATILSYVGFSSIPTDAGSYLVIATINDPAYLGSVIGTLVIAKATQTVNFGTLPAAPAVGVPFVINAAASSGLPITFSVVSGNATVNGATVTLNDTTPVALRATQAGNTNYSPATADITLSGTKQSQTITFAALADRLTTGVPFVLTATASSALPITFSVVSGPATLNGSTLALTGNAGTVTVRASQAGNGAVNAAASVDRTFTVTAVLAAPVLVAQPQSQVAVAGSSATFAVIATGNPTPTYQWRKDGVALAGSTGATLVLASVQAATAGGYDVVVTNSLGTVTSSLARLTISGAATGPVITRQPGSATVVVGHDASFTVAATGAPAPTYQWLKSSGTPGTGTAALVPGATGPTLVLTGVTSAEGGSYSVVVTNSAGSVNSNPATLTVIRRSYAGTYFGTLNNNGACALRINDDNTGVFLGFSSFSRTAYVSRNFAVDDTGAFRFATTTTGGGPATAAAPNPDFTAPATAAAVDDLVFQGTISESGALAGRSSGSAEISMTGTRSADTGTGVGVAGFYQATAANSSAQTLAIVSPDGQAFMLTQTGATLDFGAGVIDAAGRISIPTYTSAQQSIAATVSADSGALAVTVTDTRGTATTFTGFADNSAALAAQRLANLSTRATAGTGDQVAVAGFVITGLESKTVLVRAIGPALRGFGVANALTAPRLDLLRGATVLATNTGWGTAGNSAEIANAAARSGAFALTAGSADSVILTTLAPGAYTAVVSAADNRPGVGLVEIYDLSGGSAAQRLVNLSTRAATGSGDNTLIAGLVVSGAAPKRVLLRGAGPSLAQFGLTGVLAQPQLTLYSGTTVVAQNAGWSASVDAAAITEAALRSGAFAFVPGSADAALIVNLAPGAYTAQVTGVGGTAGIALVEVYELP